MAKKGTKLTQEHKDNISMGTTRSWAIRKGLKYDMDSFDFLVPMSTVLEAINERSSEGWEHEQTIVKNGVFVIYKKKQW